MSDSGDLMLQSMFKYTNIALGFQVMLPLADLIYLIIDVYLIYELKKSQVLVLCMVS